MVVFIIDAKLFKTILSDSQPAVMYLQSANKNCIVTLPIQDLIRKKEDIKFFFLSC